MGYDLKILECGITLHQFTGFQLMNYYQSIEEQIKLQVYSVFCQEVRDSIPFRDDLIDDMCADYSHAENTCLEALSNSPEVINWWWDIKNITSEGRDLEKVCDVWEDWLVEDREYADPKDTGVIIALDSFLA
mmetsp:Transcript_28419/g.21230  ORF Transcript_28419/g.21230 Transcript_28419/m.21230 type:complete len:132 (+) Transcript_28419:214-609(+)|eukprot:CAMPEP_0202960386 /NCGR_PEP_ID=MMETSP1396-20130829/4532_1 /ASSEMBLY_ACC=CAM_ASM_000872 /TAXON_ID= /ORGANISM="Pseudokeronopsis sp., Strain Brazil" /LENGTH=131 /DNA_ID=CAMNT_0049679573 /DNA_START=158 /DNA_END=553 /DNA_ORIENTATION=-